MDLEMLLREIDASTPCGPDPEFDPDFREMRRLAEGRPGQEWGSTVIAAQEPNWRVVRDRALDVLSRSKDLRAAVHLARAQLKLEGFSGLRDGLLLANGMLERYWQEVHPQLDDGDPTRRANSLLDLSDAGGTLRDIRESPLVNGALGKVSLRDLLIASGKLATQGADGDERPTLAAVDGAFKAGDPEALRSSATAVSESLAAVQSIEGLFAQRVGSERAPNLEELKNVLASIQQSYAERLDATGAATVQAGGSVDSSMTRAVAAVAASGPIRSREDVLQLLEAICVYYRTHEPSSPVPVLLQRAKRLVSKSFLEIIRDLAPDGVTQVETIRGPEEGS